MWHSHSQPCRSQPHLPPCPTTAALETSPPARSAVTCATPGPPSALPAPATSSSARTFSLLTAVSWVPLFKAAVRRPTAIPTATRSPTWRPALAVHPTTAPGRCSTVPPKRPTLRIWAVGLGAFILSVVAPRSRALDPMVLTHWVVGPALAHL